MSIWFIHFLLQFRINIRIKFYFETILCTKFNKILYFRKVISIFSWYFAIVIYYFYCVIAADKINYIFMNTWLIIPLATKILLWPTSGSLPIISEPLFLESLNWNNSDVANSNQSHLQDGSQLFSKSEIKFELWLIDLHASNSIK